MVVINTFEVACPVLSQGNWSPANLRKAVEGSSHQALQWPHQHLKPPRLVLWEVLCPGALQPGACVGKKSTLPLLVGWACERESFTSGHLRKERLQGLEASLATDLEKSTEVHRTSSSSSDSGNLVWGSLSFHRKICQQRKACVQVERDRQTDRGLL
jgi:hypothetical protein